MSAAVKLGTLAVAAAIASVLLKSHRPELVLPLQLGAAVLVLSAVLPAVKDAAAQLQQSFAQFQLPAALLSALCKGAAVCAATGFCAAVCKDSGNESLATAVLFGGRVCTLLPALPLLTQVIEIVAGFAG